jgi:hypothetical protein
MTEKKLKAVTVKNIDPALFKKFKAACVENDTDMRAALIRFMEQYGAAQKNP